MFATEKSEKRRVALMRSIFLPYSETFIHDEIRHHQRYKVTVFAKRQCNENLFPGHNVVALERIPEKKNILASIWFSLTSRSSLFDRVLAEGGFSLIHAHFGWDGVYAMGFARRHQLPLVVSLHGFDVSVLLGKNKYRPGWWSYLLRYRKLFREASLFLTASSELRDLIICVGCPKEKVVVHRLGIDLSLFTKRNENKEAKPPIVLMIGRFMEKKGHEYGIRAISKVIQTGRAVRLFIVGHGPLKPKYDSLISSLGLDNTVEMKGILPHSKVLELIQNASVVMGPSVVAPNQDRESGMIVLKEAAACGVPVIGTRHGGIPEIVDHGSTGFIVEERDVDAMANRLIELLDDHELRYSMGIAARKKMEREYDIRKRVQELENIYDAVVEGRMLA